MNLENLNTLRVANGKSPLKSWKESKAKLAAAYAAERELNIKSKPSPEAVKATVKRMAAEVVKATATPKGEAEVKRTSDVVAYALKHGLNPKSLRNKLRKAGLKAPYNVEDIEKLK